MREIPQMDETEREFWENQPVKVPLVVRLLRRFCSRSVTVIEHELESEYEAS